MKTKFYGQSMSKHLLCGPHLSATSSDFPLASEWLFIVPDHDGWSRNRPNLPVRYTTKAFYFSLGCHRSILGAENTSNILFHNRTHLIRPALLQ